MVRVFHIYVPGRTVALALTEVLVIVSALALASYAEFGSDAGLVLTYEHMPLRVALVAAVALLFMHYHDMYQSVVLQSPGAVLTRLLQVIGTVLVVCGILYSRSTATYSYELVVLWILLSALSLGMWRIGFILVNRTHCLRERIVFFGDFPLRSELLSEIQTRPELGLEVVAVGAEVQSPDLEAIVTGRKISRVVVGPSASELNLCGVKIDRAEDLYEVVFDKLPVAAGDPFPSGFRISHSALLYKKISSLLLAGAGLVLALPIMLLIAIAIRIDSAGPVIFRQRRVGKGGEPFTLYKFRSMRDEASHGEFNRPAVKGDARFTRVGRFIRRTRMDELPQLWNIVRGDMYLIGPRPFTVEMEESLSQSIPHYSERWLIKPGLTGWAQVRRAYCGTLEDNIDKLAHDLFYIKNVSIGLDLLICFETVKIVLLGRGAQ